MNIHLSTAFPDVPNLCGFVLPISIPNHILRGYGDSPSCNDVFLNSKMIMFKDVLQLTNNSLYVATAEAKNASKDISTAPSDTR